MKNYKITVLRGDGIGPEIVNECIKVLDKAGEKYGFKFEYNDQIGIKGYQFVDYSEHAISVGEDSKAISYIHLKNPQGKDVFGIGVSHNIGYASLKGIICAINRDQPDCVRDDTIPGIFEK